MRRYFFIYLTCLEFLKAAQQSLKTPILIPMYKDNVENHYKDHYQHRAAQDIDSSTPTFPDYPGGLSDMEW